MSKLHSPQTKEKETARPAHKSQNGRMATEAWFEGEPAETALYVFPALKIGRVDSPEEREADEMAHRVVGGEIVPGELARMPQRVAGQSEEGGLAVSPPIADRIQARSGQGESLPETDREFFEPRFGRGFEDVVIHRDAEANDLARGLNAKAFTVGSDIYFGSGQYSQSEDGRRLMAHELTHTVQQGAGVQREVVRREGQNPESVAGSKAGRYEGFMIGLGKSINESGKFFERIFYQITRNKQGLEELNKEEQKFVAKYSEMLTNTLKDKSPEYIEAYLDSFSRYELGGQIAGFVLELVILKRLSSFKPMYISSGIKLGTVFEKIGVVVKREEVLINGFVPHALKRIRERNFAIKLLIETIERPLVTLRQGNNKFVLISEHGAVVVTRSGKIITAWTRDQFDSQYIKILGMAMRAFITR